MAEHYAYHADNNVPFIVHPAAKARAIIINYPGYGGHIDGFEQKYVKLAELLTAANLGAVVRLGNRANVDAINLMTDLHAVIREVLAHAGEWCGKANPDIYLMGASAGAGAVAAAAASYKEVKKILLLAPAFNVGMLLIQKELAEFRGEVHALVGDKDDVVGPDSAEIFCNMALRAKMRRHIVIPNCDHQFRGTVNGQIFGKAPFWAFANDTTFPSPEGGPILY